MPPLQQPITGASDNTAERPTKLDRATNNGVDLELQRFLSSLSPGNDGRISWETVNQQEADIATLRAAILNEYTTPGGFTLGSIRDHLQFLYLTHPLRSSDDDLKDMAVVDRNNRLVKPHIRNVYLPSTDPYGPEALLQPLEGQISNSSAASALSASFLHPTLIEAAPPPPGATHPTWHQWLCGSLAIKAQIPLATRDMQVSPELQYIVATNPGAFLPLLRQLWPSQGPSLANNATFTDGMRNLPVLGENGQRYPLMETYLPLDGLRRHCMGLMGDVELFPFLALPPGDEGDAEMLRRWLFLCSDLGVSARDDIGFLLDVLGRVREAMPEGAQPEGAACRRVVALYCEIEAKCLEAAEGPTIREIVRTYIEGIGAVLVIDNSQGSAMVSRWAHIAELTQPLLAVTYQDALECTPVEMLALGSFFQRTLGVAPRQAETSVFDMGEVARQLGDPQGPILEPS